MAAGLLTSATTRPPVPLYPLVVALMPASNVVGLASAAPNTGLAPP